MTAVTDRTGATDAEFQARIAPFDAAPVPPEVVEVATVERVAFAIWGATMRDKMVWEDWQRLRYEDDRKFYREQARAAIAVMPASPAEEALRRVEAEIAEEEAYRAEDPSWEVSVLVPAEAGDEVVERIFDAVADAAYEAQPEDRTDWDIFVSATKNPTYVMTHLLRAAIAAPQTGEA